MPPVSAITVVALVVSILALLLSGIAITWQIVSWRYTGSVVKAELVAGAVGRGGLVSSSIKNWNPHLATSQGFGDLQVGVRVRNVGRTAADIQNWSIKTTSGWEYSLPGYHLNQDTPIRLEPGSQKDCWVPATDIANMLRVASTTKGGRPIELSAKVNMATGKTAESKLHRPVSLFPPGYGQDR
jgi:hypothetical protein